MARKLMAVSVTMAAMLVTACGSSEQSIAEPARFSSLGRFTARSERMENRCDKYSLIYGVRTWQAARDDAAARGGVVASVSSAEEQACIGQALGPSNS